jgi:uridine kinase
MRKIIYLNGPSFTGKSWLHNKLSIYLTTKNIKYSNVCFEQYFRTYNAELSFYNGIEQRAEKNLVLAESVQYNQFDPTHSMNIVCWPTVEAHQKNMDSCVSTFGKQYVDGRVFGYSVGRIRQLFKRDYIKNENSIIFNGGNLQEIYDAVIKYANK